MFVVVARYHAKEGKEAEIASILKEMAEHSNAEPGCALYTVNRSVEDPRRFLLYEQYHDRAAFEAHRETAHFKDLILGKVVPMLESRVPEFYKVIAPA